MDLTIFTLDFVWELTCQTNQPLARGSPLSNYICCEHAANQPEALRKSCTKGTRILLLFRCCKKQVPYFTYISTIWLQALMSRAVGLMQSVMQAPRAVHQTLPHYSFATKATMTVPGNKTMRMVLGHLSSCASLNPQNQLPHGCANEPMHCESDLAITSLRALIAIELLRRTFAANVHFSQGNPYACLSFLTG